MAVAVYPGSFDPITLGHIDIIRRLKTIFSEIIVLISHHPTKKTFFSSQERKRLVEESLKDIPGIVVEIHKGLTVDYLRSVGARVIVRGLRAVTDFEYELVMANMNKKLAPQIETMIVFASPEFYYVASSTVKEVALHGGSVTGLVPSVVEKALAAQFNRQKGGKGAAAGVAGRKKDRATNKGPKKGPPRKKTRSSM